jgi:hypothetical protein
MVVDYGGCLAMEEMPISKFKATCLATLERVRRTGRPLRVTRFGKPVMGRASLRAGLRTPCIRASRESSRAAPTGRPL